MRRSISGLAIGLLVLAASPTVAAAAGTETPQQCAKVGDDAARLACYDRIFRGAGASRDATSTATASAVAAGAAAPGATVSNTKDDFGLTEAAKRARDPEKAKVEMPDSVTDKVASVGHKLTGEMVVTLANGQVWVQIESDSRARVGVGQTVTIRKASLGSYLMVGPDKIATRVRRTK